jgi:hypothetical protein
MKCLETRWDNQTKQTSRRYKCECGVKGITTEHWVRKVVTPEPKPKAPPKMRRPKVVTKKKELIAVRKKKEEKDFSFDDMTEDYGHDLNDLGIDIPRGGGW